MADSGDSATDDKEFVRDQFERYSNRFLIRGLDRGTLAVLEDEIDHWGEWCAEFSRVGRRYREKAEACEADGRVESAADYFLQASMYYHYGTFVWTEDDDERSEAQQKARDCYLEAGEYLTPAVERLEVPFDARDATVYANLQVPADHDDGDPVVILIPGLDSTKEESFSYAAAFHRRGIATVAMEGPGQGETRDELAMSTDYHASVSAVIDHLDDRGMDISALGLFGVSLGGFYAPHATAHDDRIQACVGISGPFTVGPVSRGFPDLLVDQFKWACHTDSLFEVDDITEGMTLRDDIDHVDVPTLMITGAHDNVILPHQSERIARKAPGGEFVLYEDGGHCCTNVSADYLPETVDWLHTNLA